MGGRRKLRGESSQHGAKSYKRHEVPYPTTNREETRSPKDISVGSGKLPLALRPKMKIAALNFETMSSSALRPYNKREDAKYKNQTGAVASRISEDDSDKS